LQRSVETRQEGESVTQSEKEVLAFVKKKNPLEIEEVSDQIDEVRSLMARGYLTLVATTYDWGLDFQLALTTSGAAELHSP
jgi:hypothetical protein